MGMDLLTIAWTARSSDYDKAAVEAALATITFDWLTENADKIDPSGAYQLSEDEDEDEFRNLLAEGAEDYDAHMSGGHRYGTVYDIPNGDDLLFYIAGGGSYGDDPYEGWSALAVFINACGERPELAAAAGFFGGGIVL